MSVMIASEFAGYAEHDGAEQLLLVGELLVDGLLGDAASAGRPESMLVLR